MHQHLLQEKYLHADELCGAPHNSSYVEPYIMQSPGQLCRHDRGLAA
jgi:transposase